VIAVPPAELRQAGTGADSDLVLSMDDRHLYSQLAAGDVRQYDVTPAAAR